MLHAGYADALQGGIALLLPALFWTKGLCGRSCCTGRAFLLLLMHLVDPFGGAPASLPCLGSNF